MKELCTVLKEHCCRLAEMGQHVGVRILDILVVRDRGFKREIKLLQILIFVKGTLWKVPVFMLIFDLTNGTYMRRRSILIKSYYIHYGQMWNSAAVLTGMKKRDGRKVKLCYRNFEFYIL